MKCCLGGGLPTPPTSPCAISSYNTSTCVSCTCVSSTCVSCTCVSPSFISHTCVSPRTIPRFIPYQSQRISPTLSLSISPLFPRNETISTMKLSTIIQDARESFLYITTIYYISHHQESDVIGRIHPIIPG